MKKILNIFFITIMFFWLFFWFIQKISASYWDVFFSEIQRMWTTNSSSDEWIELKNNTNLDIDLTWWKIESEDWTPNISLSWIIKWNGFFLLERTDDDSAYQVKWDLFYSWALWNWGEKLFLINWNWEIVDQVDKKDNGKWQSGDSPSRKSMLKDDNWNWVNWEVDWNPESSFSHNNFETWNQEVLDYQSNWEDLVDNPEIFSQDWQENQSWQSWQNLQNWQNWQNWQEIVIQNILFDLQSPSYVLDKTEDLSEYICDNSKDECKINFNFEKTFENLINENWQKISKSNYYCQITFGSLSTWQENKCNPNTVIFPIWETNISIKIFEKSTDVLIIEKNILIKRLEKIELQEDPVGIGFKPVPTINTEITDNSKFSSKKQDLSIRNWIFKQKLRIKSISLNETNWDFVEIFCLNCEKKFNIWWYKIYSSKNFFHFPVQKFWKYNLENKNSIKIYLKKNCENFEENIFKTDNTDKNIFNLNIDNNVNIDKNDNFNKILKTKNFCTSKKTWLISTNWSLFFMNSNWEILDAICWQNWKEIKWKTKKQIDFLKNNDLWKWECLNTASLKKWDIFEREIFSGYNESKSWKKFNVKDLWEEKISEVDKKNIAIPVKTVIQEKLERTQDEPIQKIITTKTKLQIRLEKIRKQKNIFNKKTKFHKIYLPKEKTRVFRVKWRTLPFIKIEFLSESWEFFEVISDEKGYFKVIFDKLSKWKDDWKKFFEVKFFKDWEEVFKKNLEFFLKKDWESSNYKKNNFKKIENKKAKNKNSESISGEFKETETMKLNFISIPDWVIWPKNISLFQKMILKKEKDFAENSEDSFLNDDDFNNKKNYWLDIINWVWKFFNKINNFFKFNF